MQSFINEIKMKSSGMRKGVNTLIDGAPDEARRFKTSVLKELAITSVVYGCKRGLDKSFTMCLFGFACSD